MDVLARGGTFRDRAGSESDGGFYIVGVGASAAGLEALEQMFQSMPTDSGMAFVIVQHLSPDFTSLMDELLARHARMPVHRVEDGMEVEPNSLYLIPPKQEMIISDGKLLLTEKDPSQCLSPPIDHFFRSLARDAGRRTIAVVLSGAGSDGSRGIRNISEAGGLVIAQSVESAEFDGMPRSAIDTGLVDAVVEPSMIPNVLNRYAEHPVRSQLHSVNEELNTVNAEYQKKISEQENVLREREQFERVIAANRDGIWDWADVKQDEMWWSAGCYKLLGYEPDEFPARYSEWLRLIHPEDRERVLQTSVPAQSKCYVELHRDFDYRILHKSGEYRWYRHRAMVDHDDSGTPVRMTGSVGDIHDRKSAELQNVEGIRRRDNFLAMLSHELRNPMGAVLNAIECLKANGRCEALEGESQPAKMKNAADQADVSNGEATRIIERQTKHMARLLDDLLDVARFCQSKIEFRKEVVDLSALADDVLEAVGYEFAAKNQILHATICDGPLCVFADPARIKQAQVNLLNNASKYTPEAGDIWYDIERELGDAVISVRDTGEGIPSDLLGSIFGLFVQAETSLARSSGGMGVGLSLARSIVEAHDGSIVAESKRPEEGSIFQIRLPLIDKTLKPKPPTPHLSFRGRKLLLVEDNDDARTMLAEMLRLRGFDVAEAADGQAALGLCRSFRPDVAVIDVGLPVMDGYQLALAVREIDELAETMLIALTGYARQADRRAAIDAGFDAHLVKPLDPDALYAQISAKHATHDVT